MALQPVTRRSVLDEVFGQITTDVVNGELQPGEALPSERCLVQLFEVSRPAVRETFKRLSAAGLVEVRQDGVTTVSDTSVGTPASISCRSYCSATAKSNCHGWPSSQRRV
jgi:DNA-binding FadR family transcriptional regulator